MKGPGPGSDGRFIVMLCTGARGGMRAVVESYGRDGLFERYRVRALTTHAEGSAAFRVLLAARAMVVLLWWLLRRQVSAVHSHMAMRGSFWRKAAFNSLARLFRVPVIAHLHGSEFRQFYASQPGWRQKLIRRELESCKCVIVLSASWGALVRTIAPSARVVELPNHVRLPPVAAVERHQGAELRLLFLGLVGARKGVFELLPAFATALAQYPQMRLVVAGNGEVERASRMASELAITDRVTFPGWVAGDAKEELLAAADLYVLPSHNENFPVSLLEAMSRALPVISTRVGGIPELVRDGCDGVLVEAGDTAALSRAIVSLASDPARREQMGASARSRIADTFSDEVVLPRLYALYDTILAGKRPASDAST